MPAKVFYSGTAGYIPAAPVQHKCVYELLLEQFEPRYEPGEFEGNFSQFIIDTRGQLGPPGQRYIVLGCCRANSISDFTAFRAEVGTIQSQCH